MKRPYLEQKSNQSTRSKPIGRLGGLSTRFPQIQGMMGIASALLATVLSCGGGTGDSKDPVPVIPSSFQSDDPVILQGQELPRLLGAAPSKIQAFRYKGRWEAIPVQVDERHTVDLGLVRKDVPCGFRVLVYADVHTYSGPDGDPSLDGDDELCFMAADAADLAPIGTLPPAGTLSGSGQAVTLRDPITSALAYVYLFQAQGIVDPSAGRQYVQYQFQLKNGSLPSNYDFNKGPNPEESLIRTSAYQTRFIDRWKRDELRIFLGGATGVDILDRHTFRFTPDDCGRSEDTFCEGGGAFIANINGPVRAIRSYLGANSGYVTQRDQHFYARRYDTTSFLRVHPIPGVMDLYDFSRDAFGMKYTNNLNLQGAWVDGKADGVALGALSWEMVTGAQGTVCILHNPQSDMNLPWSSYYNDAEQPVFPACTGDGHDYGLSGPRIGEWINNTDPLLAYLGLPVKHLELTRIVYLDPPYAAATLAQTRLQGLQQPIQHQVTAWGP